jgi:hypothetical protein
MMKGVCTRPSTWLAAVFVGLGPACTGAIGDPGSDDLSP